ncbi:MAG: GNAT family N-acetyltransferase [Deltaproteobacteria bacterium]|nr:GNAT family N-acetyltransferase [Deltaproteobacteria bacterium]MBI3293656.1 GNAT family N-acetyltransferase [Deltaproteobacteria bacterium]
MTSSFSIRDGVDADLAGIVNLNDSEIPHVTAIMVEALKALTDQAFYFQIAESHAGDIIGFVLALAESATYRSLNFHWFKARYPRFVYIDRIVVSRPRHRTGAGKLLYADLFEKAQNRTPLLTCEVNIRPPNPGSVEFHQRLGFQQVGTQETEGGKKTASLLVKPL